MTAPTDKVSRLRVFHGDVAARTEALGRSLAKVSVGAQLADTGMGEFLCSLKLRPSRLGSGMSLALPS